MTKEPMGPIGKDEIDDGNMRKFETGATRDTAEGKLDFEGFLHPLFIEQFGKYMNMHRHQNDGTLRDSDNWQKGIPQDVCAKSLFRHFFEFWKEHRGYTTGNGIVSAAMGIFFNIQAYMVTYLLKHGMQDFDGDEPTPEHQEKMAGLK
jgi:hypothetical protein